MDEQTKQAIKDAVVEAFAASVQDKRYIDVSRIPLICQSIVGIDKKLDEIVQSFVTKDQFWPVKTIVYSMVGLILAGVVGALLTLVLRG